MGAGTAPVPSSAPSCSTRAGARTGIRHLRRSVRPPEVQAARSPRGRCSARPTRWSTRRSDGWTVADVPFFGMGPSLRRTQPVRAAGAVPHRRSAARGPAGLYDARDRVRGPAGRAAALVGARPGARRADDDRRCGRSRRGLGSHGEGTHGYFVYDSSVHVPLIVSTPLEPLQGLRVDAQVSLVDVAPTIAALAGSIRSRTSTADRSWPLMTSRDGPDSASVGCCSGPSSVSPARSVPASPWRPPPPGARLRLQRVDDTRACSSGGARSRPLQVTPLQVHRGAPAQLYDLAGRPGRDHQRHRPAPRDLASEMARELERSRRKPAATRRLPGREPRRRDFPAPRLARIRRGVRRPGDEGGRESLADPKDKLDVFTAVQRAGEYTRTDEVHAQQNHCRRRPRRRQNVLLSAPGPPVSRSEPGPPSIRSRPTRRRCCRRPCCRRSGRRRPRRQRVAAAVAAQRVASLPPSEAVRPALPLEPSWPASPRSSSTPGGRRSSMSAPSPPCRRSLPPPRRAASRCRRRPRIVVAREAAQRLAVDAADQRRRRRRCRSACAPRRAGLRTAPGSRRASARGRRSRPRRGAGEGVGRGAGRAVGAGVDQRAEHQRLEVAEPVDADVEPAGEAVAVDQRRR